MRNEMRFRHSVKTPINNTKYDIQVHVKLLSCPNVRDAFRYLLDNVYIRFGTKLYRQVVGVLMGTKCAPLVAHLMLVCYERGSTSSRSVDNQIDNQVDIMLIFNSKVVNKTLI